MCRARDPIFSPKFPYRSVSFSQMTQYSAPEHHHFKFFSVPETIIFTISLRSGHTSPPVVGLLQPDRTRSGSDPGLAAGQSASQKRPTLSSGDPHFHARARCGAPHFHALSGTLSLCRNTYLPKFGQVPPPPPPPPPRGISVKKYPSQYMLQNVSFTGNKNRNVAF